MACLWGPDYRTPPKGLQLWMGMRHVADWAELQTISISQYASLEYTMVLSGKSMMQVDHQGHASKEQSG